MFKCESKLLPRDPGSAIYKSTEGMQTLAAPRAVGSRGAAAPPGGGQGICTSTRLNTNIIQKNEFSALN